MKCPFSIDGTPFPHAYVGIAIALMKRQKGMGGVVGEE
jgi:hypothetical protein